MGRFPLAAAGAGDPQQLGQVPPRGCLSPHRVSGPPSAQGGKDRAHLLGGGVLIEWKTPQSTRHRVASSLTLTSVQKAGSRLCAGSGENVLEPDALDGGDGHRTL